MKGDMNKKTKKVKTQMRRFHLIRTEDESGISGTGLIVEGIEFTNGKCSISWLTPYTSVSIFDSIKVLEEVHGHQGKTRIEYYD